MLSTPEPAVGCCTVADGRLVGPAGRRDPGYLGGCAARPGGFGQAAGGMARLGRGVRAGAYEGGSTPAELPDAPDPTDPAIDLTPCAMQDALWVAEDEGVPLSQIVLDQTYQKEFSLLATELRERFPLYIGGLCWCRISCHAPSRRT